jgi:hypothetical protein
VSEVPSKETQEAPPLLLAELLYENPPKVTPSRVRDRLAIAMPGARLVSNADKGTPILIAHEDQTFELNDGKRIHPLTTIMEGNPVDSTRFATALSQTWDWSAAREAVGRSRYQLLVCEMMARSFEYHARVEMFLNVLLQIEELDRPVAIHCHHAERVLEPSRLIRASGASDSAERMSAILNVRLFRIENSQSGEMLMDTRGLAALGLPDLQIHFRGLEPGRVAAMLYNTALYVYANGDCIKDGHTIQGLAPDQKWRCQHEEALVAPKRLVIDIDPGDPFAAGKRNR